MKKILVATTFALAATAMPTVSMALDLSFNVGAVSDYRYRGISQTRLKPALQGGVDMSMGAFYLGTWASTVKWIKDGNSASSNKLEIDLYGGYKGEIAPGMGFDVGFLTYQYPGHKAGSAGLTSPVTNEIYGALTFGPATVKYSHAISNLFGFADSKNSGYFDVSATLDVGAGVMLTPHLGYQKVTGSGNKPFSYTDYSVSAAYEVVKGLTVSGGIYGTDDKNYTSPVNGKNLGKAGLVLGAKYAF